MSDQELLELRERNAQRAAVAIERMGTRYACHPANLVRRDPVRTRFMLTEMKIAAPLILLKKGR